MKWLTLILTGYCLFVAGCGSETAEEHAVVTLPTMKELENLTYPSSFTQSGTAPLVNGSFEEQTGDALGTVIVVTLTNLRLTGYVNAKTQGSAVIIRTSAGPNGTFYDLATVIKDSSGARVAALTSLGDRIKVKNLALEDNKIRLQMTIHGPNDQPCCPTVEVLNTYELRGKRIVLLTSEPYSE